MPDMERFIPGIISKIRNKQFIFLIDFQLILISYLFSFLLRFDFQFSLESLKAIIYTFPILFIIKIAIYFYFRIHRIIWRYTGIRDLILIIKASSIGNIAYATIFYLLFHFTRYPRAVIIIDWALFIMFLGGIRLIYRYFLKSYYNSLTEKKRCLIIGSKDAAESLIRAMISNEINYEPLGILDNDSTRWNRYIHGVKIYGPIKDVCKVSEKFNIEEIIIAITSASANEMKQVIRQVSSCHELDIPYKIVPSINELLSGQKSPIALREVRLEDLLNRELVITDKLVVRKELKNKAVLITGSAGSIGSELVRQVAACQPSQLILIDRNENNLRYLEKELENQVPTPNITAHILDITDEVKLERIFSQYNPSYVFHAAAYKHVIYMENAPDEAVKNNVYGTHILARMAEKYNADKFVLISTDKAVNPTSVMGCSKRLAELCILNLFKDSSTKFVIVRFGNVIGSEGSVIPIFQKQIKNGGPITITDPNMKRYFMTIPEAVRLTLHASYIGDHGEILSLDMGEQIPILEIAENLIILSGLRPYDDIKIKFTGVKQGEKLKEEVWNSSENPIPTAHPKIFKTIQNGDDNVFDFNIFNDLIEMSFKHEKNEKIMLYMKKLVEAFEYPVIKKSVPVTNH